MGDLMRAWSGSKIPLPGTPSAGEPVNVLDVIVHLGREGRYGGWGSREWTVLHHSLLVSVLYGMVWPDDVAGAHAALFHDGHEAYGGDIPTPIKAALGKEWRAAWDSLMAFFDAAIRQRLKLRVPSDEQRDKIKACDVAALIIEASHFAPPGAQQDVIAGIEQRDDADGTMRKRVCAVLRNTGHETYVPHRWRTLSTTIIDRTLR